MQKEAAAMDAKVRRAAKRVGLRAIKSRWRLGSIENFGKFMLNDPLRNMPAAGERFDLDAETVIAICEKRRAS
jgi:hypothetical protein